jgi:hypothetical protein
LIPLIPPDKLALYVGTDQLYNVPSGTKPFVECTGVTWNSNPSQVTAVIAEIEGRGFTVITTVKVLLFEQLLAWVGCIVNVTDWAILDVLEKVPVMAELVPVNTVQVKDVEAVDVPTTE